MTFDSVKCLQLIEATFEALREGLSDPALVRRNLSVFDGHAPGFNETVFCKACVLPIVDRVITKFLRQEFNCSSQEIHSGLRCEGYTTIREVYLPAEDQSGFSGATWGTNRQPVSKSGRRAPTDHPGYIPCPDFGVIVPSRGIALLGETKLTAEGVKAQVSSVANDLDYYLRLPIEPDKNWIYNCGLGIAYAAGGTALRSAELSLERWKTDRYAIASFQA